MFHSRQDAGNLLARKLIQANVLADMVIGLPRGGVVVAYEIAQKLNLPLDTLMVKKIGAPYNPELGIGAVSLNNISYLDNNLINKLSTDNKYIQTEIKKLGKELIKREKSLRFRKEPLDVLNKKVILTDDGAATGATVFAAISWLKKHFVKSIIVALPVVPQELILKLQSLVDLCIILESAEIFQAVGEFYQDFREVSDEEVVEILSAVSFQSSAIS